MKYEVILTFKNEPENLNIKTIYVGDFVRKREILVDMLNPMYEAWNNEFDETDHEILENDPLEDYGGTAYCNFIREKQERYLAIVNSLPGRVSLAVDETGDIYGKIKNSDNEIHLALKEVND